MASSAAVDRPAMATNPRYIFFTDFDGTITLQDTNDWMTDHIGFGAEKRKGGNGSVLTGERSFCDSFQEMMDSINNTPYEECIELLKKNIALDPKFVSFFDWCDSNNVPIVILSGGMEPVIHGLLSHWLGEDNVRRRLQIVSNNVVAREPGVKDMWKDAGGWRLTYHDESSFGHDKSIEIRKYSKLTEAEGRPVIFYAGDGVSDLSAAHEADLMFAKAGKDLVAFCDRENVPYTEFNDFGDIAKIVEDIVEGRTTVEAVVNKK
ncbi:diketo-5-methylthio-1-phosphopentane phosphatase [Ophiostoma piceae UAMH 11346]|uniref:Diketo-5-methylthio-1-phosphopentane phosphatase n=1 Tax=Ophiostoma piceae (strain UAMH 11346) TaxID=1262450 RepID=S3C0D3_OPHP1|nr:diketo-5-methylthio-1-phosphopentane phosphatase [Ophiostoma piceae UAMH 11346]